MKYCCDTSGISVAWHRHYPPDRFPGIWRKIDHLIEEGNLISCEDVYLELEKDGTVELLQWAKKHRTVFLEADDEVQAVMNEIMDKHKKLVDERSNRSSADPWIIAFAKAKKCKLISYENESKSPIKRPHIPDVCKAIGVEHITLVELFREQNWTFE